LTPQIFKRVHQLYEELGRADVQAVEDWEKAKRESDESTVAATPGRPPKAEGTPKPEVKAEPKPAVPGEAEPAVKSP
jgi:hypothetical protein